MPSITLRRTRRLLSVAAISVGSLVLAGSAGATPSNPFFQPLPASGNTQLQTQRQGAVAAPLPGGKVLIAGGWYTSTGTHYLATAEIYDPETGAFTALPDAGNTRMNTPRARAMAAPLPDGRVLIVGGYDGSIRLEGAEVFNPADDTFTPLPDSPDGALHSPREAGAAVALHDGRVLIVGGNNGGDGLNSAEIFNPATMTFTALPASGYTVMQTLRDGPAAAVLDDGRVLVAGGFNQDDDESRTADVFDPATDTFSPLPLGHNMTQRRRGAVAASLPDGKVLIAGGYNAADGWLSSSELFDPATNTFSAGPNMSTWRLGAVAAPLPTGRVLVAGGFYELSAANTFIWLQSAELFEPAAEARTSGGGDFGSQPVGTTSLAQNYMVTNLGAQALTITGASLAGTGNPGDFAIASNTCLGDALGYKQSCMIGVRFTPQAAGARSARIDLADNEQTPSTISLSGTGMAPAGPTGAPSGTTPGGGGGGIGGGVSQRKPAQVDVLSCKTVHAPVHKAAIERCTSRLLDGKVRLSKTTIRATLKRGRTVYASGSATGRGAKLKLILTPRRELIAGSYTLTLKTPRRHHRRATTKHLSLTLVRTA